jgi:hypothetical protein
VQCGRGRGAVAVAERSRSGCGCGAVVERLRFRGGRGVVWCTHRARASAASDALGPFFINVFSRSGAPEAHLTQKKGCIDRFVSAVVLVGGNGRAVVD